MTRRELIEWVRRELATEGGEAPTASEVGKILDAAFAGIAHGLQAEGRYTHPGFGTFTRKEQPARPGINPRTGAPIMIAAATTVSFKPAREFKGSLE